MEKKTHILVVDDEQYITKLVERTLEDAGYVVTVANDGNSALAMLAEREPDLVLLDIRMPGKSGTELLAEIKTSYPDTAVIMATVVTDTHTAVQCMKDGAYDYITKPFDLDEVVLSVRRALEERRLELENRDYQQHLLQKVEEQLRVSEVKYRSLFEDSMDGVHISTRDGKYVDVNQAMSAMFGYSREEMIGMDTRKVYVNPADRDKFQQDIEPKGYLKDYEMKCRKQDGTEIYCVLASTMRRDNGGSILGYQGIVRDVTEHKQIEKERKQMIEELRATVEGSMQAIGFMSETRDPYTAGHQQRVTKIACAIAEEMNLPEEQKEIIRMAAMLHDIGKICVPAEILNKPGKLSEIEMSMIKNHPKVSCEILKTVNLPLPVCPVVLQHHERINGSGYPKGLSEKDIRLEAKILAVADIVEAMASHRPYRPALGIDKALEEISQNRGILYDSNVVDACLKVFADKRIKFD